MFVVRLIKWTAVFLVLLLVAAGSYLHFADLELLKPRIEAAFEQATGRQLRLAGPLDIDLLPLPALVIEDVTVANVEWGSEPEMAKAGHASARIRLLSLFTGPVRVRNLELWDVNLLLESDEAGKENWTFDGGEESVTEPQPETPSEARPLAVVIESAELRNVVVRYKEAGGDPLTFDLASLELTTDEAMMAHVEAEAQVNGSPLRLSGKLGVEDPAKGPEGIVIDLAGGLGALEVTLQGTLGDPAKGAGIDLNLLAASDDLAGVLDDLGVDLPLTGPLRVEAAVTNAEPGIRTVIEARAGELAASLKATRHAGAVSFSATVPALDKAGAALGTPSLPAGDLAIEGRVAISRDGYRLEGVKARAAGAEIDLDGLLGKAMDAASLSVKARGPSLAALDATLPAIPFTLTTNADLAAQHIALQKIEARFGESDLAGSLEVSTGEKPAITGRFKSRVLDLSPFAGEPDAAQKAKQDAPAEGKQQAKIGRLDPNAAEPGGPKEYVFAEEPFDKTLFSGTALDIQAETARFVLDELVVLDLSAGLERRDGRLALRQKGKGPYGGNGSIDVSIASASSAPELRVRSYMRDMRLNLLSGDLAEPTLIPPVGITLELDSKGNSPREMAAGMSGRLLLTQGKGQVRNSIVERVSGDVFAQLFNALNPFAKQDEYTRLECTVVALDIENGQALIPALYVQGKRVKIVGGGSINLKTEVLNVEFNTKPRKGVGVRADMFVTPFVKLVGTLANPHIGLDEKGVLLAGASAATGGLALLAKVAIDRLTGEIDACDQVLEEVGGHPPMPE